MELGRHLKAIVFDFDGTLLHLDVDGDRVRRELGVGPGETVGAAIARLRDSGDPRLDALTAIELAALGDARVDPAIVATLEALAVSYRIAVCSRNSRRVVRRAFDGTGLGDLVHVVGREEVTRLKPDPEGLRRILEHFGVAPEAAALVGDTYHDVEAARAAGMYSIVVANARLAYPPDGADRYVEWLTDLPALLASPTTPSTSDTGERTHVEC